MANAERWKRLDELFSAATDLPETERDQYLSDTCATDPDLLREVQALLCHDGPGTASLDLAIQQIASHLADDDFWLGRQVGAYRIVRELGVGGMGAVYLAERADQRFEKLVAIKLVHRAMDSSALRQRLLAERRILATLDHPYIAKLIDGGETTEGVPYFVMEYVEGLPINRYAAGLSTAAKCELLAKVCEGVSHAHRRMILHLDLKPSNILITSDGTPKLLDFGISALLRENAGEFVAANQHAFTPDYASPETVAGLPLSISADVYSLGVILREILTGKRTPTAAPLSRDLTAILGKATSADPADRYAAPDQLALDLSRSLRQYPIGARKAEGTYLVRRFLQRNRLAVAGIVLAFVGLSMTAAVAVSQASLAKHARDESEVSRNEAIAQRHVAESRAAEALAARATAEREHGIATTERDHAVQQTRIAESRLIEFTALADNTIGDLNDLLERLPGATSGRRKIVADTMVFLDKTRAANPGNLPLLTTVAAGYLRLAELLGQPFRPNLGDIPESHRNLEKAEAIAGEMLKRYPSDERLQAIWLECRALKADLLDSARHAEQGAQLSLEAVHVVEGWRRARPRSEPLMELESMLRVKVSRLAPPGSTIDSLKQIQLAIALMEPLFRKYPDNDRLAEALGVAYGLRQQALAHAGKRETMFDDGNKAIQIFEQLLKKTPDDVVRMRTLAMTHNWQGHISADVFGDNAAAKISLRKALVLLERISARDPANVSVKEDLAMGRFALGELMTAPPEQAEGLALMRQSAKYREGELKDGLLLPGQISDLARCMTAISHVSWIGGDASGAIESAKRALELSLDLVGREPGNSTYQLSVVGAYARILPPAGKVMSRTQAEELAHQGLMHARRYTSQNRLRRFLPRMLASQGEMYEGLGDRPSACESYREGLDAWNRLDPAAKRLAGIEAEIAKVRDRAQSCH